MVIQVLPTLVVSHYRCPSYIIFLVSNVILLYFALVGVCRRGGTIVLRASGYSVCPCFD